jgi:hypothetical protein
MKISQITKKKRCNYYSMYFLNWSLNELKETKIKVAQLVYVYHTETLKLVM